MPNLDFAELRGNFDGSESFMTQGHQIIKMRRIDRSIPEWAKSNKKIQQILLCSFPKLKTDARQRARAARWSLIIHLYFRMQMTRGQIAAQLKVNPNTVKMVIRRITKKTNEKGVFVGRSAGRPRK